MPGFRGVVRPYPGPRTSLTTYFCSPNVTIGAGPSSTGAVLAGQLYYQPLWLPNLSIDRIGIEVTVGAAGNCRLGLYANNNGVPGALIVDAGTVSTGSAAIVEATITERQLPGWCWMAALFEATPTVRLGLVGSSGAVMGADTLSGGARGMTAVQAYGALPATATAPSAYAATAPMIVVRKS